MVLYIPPEVWNQLTQFNSIDYLGNSQYRQQIGRKSKLIKQLDILYSNYEYLYFHYPTNLKQYWKRYIDGVSIYIHTPLSRRSRRFHYIKTYFNNESFNAFLLGTTMTNNY
jgi:hypothetical protein